VKILAIVLFILLTAASSAFAQTEATPDSTLVEVWVATNFSSIIIAAVGHEDSCGVNGLDSFFWPENQRGPIEFLFLTTKRNKELAKAYLPGVDLGGVAVCYFVRGDSLEVRAVHPLLLTFPGKCPAKWIGDVPYAYGFFYLKGKDAEIFNFSNNLSPPLAGSCPQ